MEQIYAIGVDVSKSKIDCAVLSFALDMVQEKQVRNADADIRSYLGRVLKMLKIQPSQLLVCCETTGIYNRPLERVCTGMGIVLWVEHALKIKRASTDMRGKTDRRDARRIAEYAIRYRDRQICREEPSQVLREMDMQVKIRETLLKEKGTMENQLGEAKSHDPERYRILEAAYRPVLRGILKAIEKAEERIRQLIEKDASIAAQVRLVTGIPGIGTQNAINLIIATNNFRDFNSAKHLACYAGVVPFQNQSGTVTKRERVSKMANGTLKRLLHMAAMAAIRFDAQLKAYYIRKVSQGKNKMSVLNAVRNKLVHRIMAVVNRQTPFVCMAN